MSQDGYIVKTIRRLPNLNALIITIERTKRLDKPFLFEDVPVYCSESSIELIINFDAMLPPFE